LLIRVLKCHAEVRIRGQECHLLSREAVIFGNINGNPTKKIATFDLFNEGPDINAIKVLLSFARNYPSAKQRLGLYWVKVCSMYSSAGPRDETYEESMDHSIALGTEF